MVWGRRNGARRTPWLVVALGALLALVLVAPLGPGSPSPAQADARVTTARCADLVVLGARASGQRLTGANREMGTEVYAMARDAVSRLSGRHSVRYAGLPYPAVPTSRGTSAYEASVREGVGMLRTRLVRLLRACPRTKVALAGFSQGAHVVHRSLAGLRLTPGQTRRVVAVGLVADPTYNARSGHAHQVRYGVTGRRLDGLLGPGRALRPRLAARTIDFCHPDDMICSFGGPDGEIWMARWAGRQHTAFYEQPATVRLNGAWFARVMRDHGVR